MKSSVIEDTERMLELFKQVHVVLAGNLMQDVLGVALAIACVAAKNMEMDKLQTQKMLVKMWDEKIITLDLE